MPRVSKYWRIMLFAIIILMFAMRRLHFQSLFARDLFGMIVGTICAVWMMKYGYEGITDRRQIKGKPTDRQKADYYISQGQFISGIMMAIFIIFFSLFQSSWRVFDCGQTWLGVAPH